MNDPLFRELCQTGYPLTSVPEDKDNKYRLDTQLYERCSAFNKAFQWNELVFQKLKALNDTLASKERAAVRYHDSLKIEFKNELATGKIDIYNMQYYIILGCRAG